MTIARAKKFIRQGQVDEALRDRLNNADSMTEITATLNDYDLCFSPGEFEKAYRNLLTQCQTEDSADQLKEFKMWWDLLTGFTGGATTLCGGGDVGSLCSSSDGCSGCH